MLIAMVSAGAMVACSCSSDVEDITTNVSDTEDNADATTDDKESSNKETSEGDTDDEGETTTKSNEMETDENGSVDEDETDEDETDEDETDEDETDEDETDEDETDEDETDEDETDEDETDEDETDEDETYEDETDETKDTDSNGNSNTSGEGIPTSDYMGILGELEQTFKDAGMYYYHDYFVDGDAEFLAKIPRTARTMYELKPNEQNEEGYLKIVQELKDKGYVSYYIEYINMSYDGSIAFYVYHGKYKDGYTGE